MLRRETTPGGCAIVVLLVVVLLMPASARGAVVQLRMGGRAPASTADLQLTGLPGESNVVTVELVDTGVLRVRDEGAPLIAGENCSGDGGEVVCSGVGRQATLMLAMALSDGDDRLAIIGSRPYTYSFLSGGSGSDIISGGSGPDSILGGSGDDSLDGGAGDDELIGGTGADALHGGAGSDTAVFDDHSDAVSVTIDGRADDGASGEGDDVGLDVENVTGGQGANRLVGSDADNTLEGGRGVNELSGGAGDDRLVARNGTGGVVSGGSGRDTLSVAPDSSVDVRDGEADQVECDLGLSRPPLADAADELSGCVPRVDVRATIARVDRRGRVRLPIRCYAVDQPCHVRLALRWRSRLLAQTTLDAGAGRTRVSLALDRLGRRLVERHASLHVTQILEAFRAASPRSEGAPEQTPLILRRT